MCPTLLPPGEPAAANTEFTLYPRPHRCDDAAGSDRAAFRALFQRVAARLVGRRAGDLVRIDGRPCGGGRAQLRSSDPDVSSARTHYVLSRNGSPRTCPSQDRATARQEQRETTRKRAAALLRHLVEDRGLRAKLETGSLLTGELYVGFEYVPNAPKPKIDWSQDPLELPVASGGLASIEAKLNSILTKVDNMPLGDDGWSTSRTCSASLNQTLKQTDALIGRVDAEWVPEGTKTMEELHRAIADADRSLLGRDAPTSQDLHDTCAGTHRYGALGPRLRRLSATAPRNVDPWQERGTSMTRRIAAIGAACALARLIAGCASPPSTSVHLESRRDGDLQSRCGFLQTRHRGRRTGVDTRHRRPSADRGAHEPESSHAWMSSIAGHRRCGAIFRTWSPTISSHCSGHPTWRCTNNRRMLDADYRVAIDVQTFESAPGDAATLSALWIVRRVKDGKTQIGRTTVREATTGTATMRSPPPTAGRSAA